MKQRFTIKEASIAFTGHRNIAPEQKDKVRERLRKAVSLAYIYSIYNRLLLNIL